MINEVLIYLGIAIGYYIFSASLALLIKKIVKVSSELWRKMLHLIAFNFVFVLLYVFPTWQIAVTIVFVFMTAVYMILTLIEHLPQYSSSLSERKDGEIKMSLILICVMFIILTVLFWGNLGTSGKYIILISVMAWGYGDAAAALFGKRYGRHYLEHRFIEGKKTMEGTLAMFVVSLLAIFFTTTIYAGISLNISFIIAIIVAPICTIVELFSRHGADTITVPSSAAIATYLITYLLTFMGGII